MSYTCEIDDDDSIQGFKPFKKINKLYETNHYILLTDKNKLQ